MGTPIWYILRPYKRLCKITHIPALQNFVTQINLLKCIIIFQKIDLHFIFIFLMWMRISIISHWFWYIIFICHISWFLFALAFMFVFVKILNAWKFIDFQWNVFSNQSCLRFWHLHNYIHQIFELIICHSKFKKPC